MTSDDFPYSDWIGTRFGDYVVSDILEVYATDKYGNKIMMWRKKKEEEDNGNNETN